MFLHSKLPLDLLWEQNWWKSFFGDPKIFGISKNCFGGQNELAIYDFVKGWGISQPQTFQPQASTPNHSTSDFSTPWFKNSWLKSLGLKGPGLKFRIEKSEVEMSFNHAVSLYLLRRINPESKFYFRSQGYWVNIWHNFVQERCINYSYAGKVGWWANHSLGTVKVPFLYYVSIFLGLK